VEVARLHAPIELDDTTAIIALLERLDAEAIARGPGLLLGRGSDPLMVAGVGLFLVRGETVARVVGVDPAEAFLFPVRHCDG